MAFNEKCRIESHHDAAPGYKMLTLHAPQIAGAVTPGQFVHVKVPGLEPTALRRPLSVFDGNPASGEVIVLYKVVQECLEDQLKQDMLLKKHIIRLLLSIIEH